MRVYASCAVRVHQRAMRMLVIVIVIVAVPMIVAVRRSMTTPHRISSRTPPLREQDHSHAQYNQAGQQTEYGEQAFRHEVT